MLCSIASSFKFYMIVVWKVVDRGGALRRGWQGRSPEDPQQLGHVLGQEGDGTSRPRRGLHEAGGGRGALGVARNAAARGQRSVK